MPAASPVRLAIFASGRGSNAMAIIGATRSGRLPLVESVLVVCDREGAPVLDLARNEGVDAELFSPRSFGSKEAYETAVLTRLRDKGVTAIALAGYMRLVGPVLIEAFPERILNIHPSLLPAFPGLDAQGQALTYGVRVTGVTVHFVDLLMDHGPVILQRSVPVLPDDTRETLGSRLLPVEHETYIDALAAFSSGRLRIAGRHVHWM